MEAETTTEKPKRTVSPELKAKMKAGRERAAAERERLWKERNRAEHEAAAKAKKAARELAKSGLRGVQPEAAPTEFLGITKNDCPVDCTPEHCVIAGSLAYKNDDGSTTLVGHCGHPCKGGLAPIQKVNRVIVERYNRARKNLAHVELVKRP